MCLRLSIVIAVFSLLHCVNNYFLISSSSSEINSYLEIYNKALSDALRTPIYSDSLDTIQESIILIQPALPLDTDAFDFTSKSRSEKSSTLRSLDHNFFLSHFVDIIPNQSSIWQTTPYTVTSLCDRTVNGKKFCKKSEMELFTLNSPRYSSFVESSFIPSQGTEEAWTNYSIQNDFITRPEKATKSLIHDRRFVTATKNIHYNLHFSLKKYLIDRPWFTPPESIFIRPQGIHPQCIDQFMLPVAVIVSQDICLKEYPFPLSEKKNSRLDKSSRKKVLKSANDTGKVVFQLKGMGITALLCKKVYITVNQVPEE